MAMNTLANSLSGGGSSVYMTDDDPTLVGQALPFSLKLMETVLEETPEHEALLVATGSGFVMYAHAYSLRPARLSEATDLRAARRERARAKALFLRGRGYVGRALEVRHPGIVQELLRNPDSAVRELDEDDLSAMYWFAAAHGSAVSTDKSDMALVADFPVVPALLNRALELDETWNEGAFHELLISVAASQAVGPGGGGKQAERHFDRAMELNGGRSVGPIVTLAETVCVQRQDRERFNELLNQALAFDADSVPENRLANLLAQEHAAWLLSRVEELFFDGSTSEYEDIEREHTPESGGLVRWPIHM
jgi:predicted anti-sigma-YlaC factor YlaD